MAKLADLETIGDSTGTGVLAGAAVELDTAPFSRLTNFNVGCLPEKNSPAVNEGSEDGAGGKMSDWKESDCASGETDTVHQWGEVYLSWDDERDRLDSRCRHLIGSGNLTLGHLQCATRKEAHSTLGVRRLVFGKGKKGVGFVLVIPNVPISVRDLSDERNCRQMEKRGTLYQQGTECRYRSKRALQLQKFGRG